MRGFLTERNPKKKATLERSHVPKDDAYPAIQPSGISRWSPFNINTINHTHGHLLDAEITNHGAVSQLEALEVPENRIIETVGGLARWCQQDMVSLVGASLKQAATPSLSTQSLAEYTRFGVSPDKTMLPAGVQKYGIDFFMGFKDANAQTIVVGEVKSHLDLRSSNLLGPMVERQHLSRLRRLAHLCKTAGTKYGFFYTDEELIVCRFDSGYLGVSIESVNWDGEGPLTTQLALWYQCVIAIDEIQGLSAYKA